MKKKHFSLIVAALLISSIVGSTAFAQMGKRFPSEKKIVIDPVTGTPLTFLTSTPKGDSKMYQTDPQWSSDGQWIIFRGNRVPGEGLAVNQKTGVIVQVTEGGYASNLIICRKSMRLFIMRRVETAPTANVPQEVNAPAFGPGQRPGGGRGQIPGSPIQIIEINLARLFADSEAGKLQKSTSYERICGTIPAEMGAGGWAIDANEDYAYFVVGGNEAAKHPVALTKIPEVFIGRTGATAVSGLASINLNNGEIKFIISVPFSIGHLQVNPWMPGELVFCWETGGKAPQRTWIVNSDGTGFRALYPESETEWITHEAVITRDEVAIFIMGHRPVGTTYQVPSDPPEIIDPLNPGQQRAWGPSGTREKPTGLGVVNLRTREMRIVAQTPSGSGLWHGNGSEDGRWLVGDDFSRSIYLIDRHNNEMVMLSTGHKPTAQDHTHPSFSPDGTQIEIQSAMLSEDNRTMNICLIPVPKSWLDRKYSAIAPK
jgi:oligogalacturonide lyase